ncbi:MAG: nucleotide exchange factor GrpE [Candidatus Omnitrophica bacterium]|nr:nucleotide exchange factor GrpE [Candidatus Omnitrophota bacterium]
MKGHKDEEVKKDGDMSGGDIHITGEEMETLRKKAEERDSFHDKWLKVHAEYENTRRRLEKDKNDQVKFANEMIISQLVPIMDNFDLAFNAMESAPEKSSVMEGIKIIQKEFHRVLEDNGVRKIDTHGQQFDPNLHEAVAMVDSVDIKDNTIVEEVRAGYMLNGRLLRPAQVKVARNDTE